MGRDTVKRLIALLVCIFLAGCSPGGGNEGLGKEVYPVVQKYLEDSASGNWNAVYEALSGEALAEAKANSGRVKVQEKIIRKNLTLTPVCDGIAEVAADFTVGAGGGFDRLAYKFRLKSTGDKWLIYKTEHGEYIHGQLRPGRLPPEIAAVIKTYLELPFNEKRTIDYKYLAGRILQDSQKAKLLPADNIYIKEQERIKTIVKTMDCLGMADGYAIVRVGCDVLRDGAEYPVEALVEALDVNGAWKICRMDITKS